MTSRRGFLKALGLAAPAVAAVAAGQKLVEHEADVITICLEDWKTQRPLRRLDAWHRLSAAEKQEMNSRYAPKARLWAPEIGIEKPLTLRAFEWDGDGQILPMVVPVPAKFRRVVKYMLRVRSYGHFPHEQPLDYAGGAMTVPVRLEEDFIITAYLKEKLG